MSTHTDGAAARQPRWSAGQRALMRFLEREGILAAEPEVAAVEDVVPNRLLFQALEPVIPPADLAALLSAKLRLAVVDLEARVIDDAIVQILPAHVAIECEAVALGAPEGLLELAMANPLDLGAVKATESASGRRARLCVATHAGIRRALARYYGAPAEPVAPLAGMPPVAPTVAPEADEPAAAQAAAAAAPVPAPAAPARPPRVVVIDADLARRTWCRSRLADADPACVIVTARDVREASAVATLDPPDLMVLGAVDPSAGTDVPAELRAAARAANIRIVPLAAALEALASGRSAGAQP